MIIKNRDELLSHGNVEGRKAVLDILEAGLGAADPYWNVRNLIRIEDGKLIVGNDQIKPGRLAGLPTTPETPPPHDGPLVFDLSEVGNIYVVGGGKAAQRQAKAIEDVLGDLITEGHVNAKKGDTIYLERIKVTLAGHPIPDEDSVKGAQCILEIEQKAKKGDIVFLSESGGGSALMALPAPGISLEDIKMVNRVLYFGCGCSMPEANAVRNQLALLRVKHARHVGDATMIHIATPEIPPNLRVHLHATHLDTSGYEEAKRVLNHYGCWDKMSQSVRDFLLRADPQYGPLRPWEWDEKPRYYFRVMGPEYMLEAAKRKAKELGLDAKVLISSWSDIDARAAGDTAAYIAQEAEVNQTPIEPPCILLAGGELVVAVGDEAGIGGRNQEFALAAAARTAGSENIVIASADSDGGDGPTTVAGGIVDGDTMGRAQAMGMDLVDILRRHDTGAAMEKLGDTIVTGVQPTNVQDLRVIYVGGHK
jgi:glycerate 2-kinase